MRNQEVPVSVHNLADLGWSPFFADQIEAEADSGQTESGLIPVRAATVQRSLARGLGADGLTRLVFPNDISASDLAVGDWILIDPETHMIRRVLDRHSKLSRRAAGVEAKSQLLVANLDTLFITTSCNEDFNPARIERYLVLALDADVTPVLVLTKSDLTDEADRYLKEAQGISPKFADVLCINATVADGVATLERWCGAGQTVAFVGSSGVGKSTLINSLTEAAQATAGIRETDAKGRHTTTSRSLHFANAGGMVIDMPGMRELGLHDVASGIAELFDDITDLAATCKFRNCAHVSEPGCAVLAAMDAGEISEARLDRWRKLHAEDQLNSQTMGQTRRRAKEITRQHKATLEAQYRMKGKRQPTEGNSKGSKSKGSKGRGKGRNR
jgi:ribosome biogenesis GTPase